MKKREAIFLPNFTMCGRALNRISSAAFTSLPILLLFFHRENELHSHLSLCVQGKKLANCYF